jgi:hypothetical protein
MYGRLALALTLAALAACAEDTTSPDGGSVGGSTDGGTTSGSGTGGGTGGSQPGAGTVTGLVLDTQGHPIPNARVWMQPALTTGLYETRTGADGRYRANGLSWVPYYAKAWTEVNYNGKRYCLRLGMPKAADFDAFTAEQGAVRNFRWQLEGVIEDLKDYDGYFGGEARVFNYGTLESGAKVELRLAPTGPLIDGSTGKVITRTVDDGMIYDVPIGVYTVTATMVRQGGGRVPLVIGPSGSAMTTSTTLTFDSDGSCSNSNGTKRAYLYWGDAK